MMGAMKILMTGATGFLGRQLWPILRAEGHSLVVLARDTSRTTAVLPGVTAFEWNGLVGLPPSSAFDGVEAIVNFIGEPIAKRWNGERKRRFRDSRKNRAARWLYAVNPLYFRLFINFRRDKVAVS